jgi:hypothetical protein
LPLLTERPDVAKWLDDVIASDNPPYIEVSPSGTGLRMFLRGKLNGQGRKGDKLEIYNNDRFLTITGHVWDKAKVVSELPTRQDLVDSFQALLQPKKAHASQSPISHAPRANVNTEVDCNTLIVDLQKKYRELWAGKWENLDYPSQSEADFALLGHICRGIQEQNGGKEVDGETLRVIFEQSGLYRPEKHQTLVNHSIPNILAAMQVNSGQPNQNPRSIQQVIRDKFVLIQLGGKICMLEQDNIAKVQNGDPMAQLQFLEIPHGKLLIRREIEAYPIPCLKPKEVIEDFFKNPETIVFKGVACSPLTQPPDILNLWTGPIVTPQPGCWDVIRHYLYNVICDCDQDLYQYLINYLAHMLQQPQDKPEVMIVLMGDEGAGKSFYFRLLKAIWGRSALLVQDMDSVVGQFNKPLETAFVVCMDEALFVGDKKAQDKLKSMITEPTIQIEQKYEPRHQIASFHRFAATTNRDHFAQIRSEDRRYLFIRVSNIHQQDQSYFADFSAALADGITVPAFVDHLLSVDLTEYNPRLKPATKERSAQKILSLSGFPRYWYEALYEGKIYGAVPINSSWQQGDFVQSSTLVNQYKEYDRSADKYGGIQSSTIHKELVKMCPSIKPKRQDNKRGFELPTLDQARQEFDVYLGDKVPWPD